MPEQYDVVIIGAGPAGYVAAIRCAQLGLSTAVIDEWTDPQGKPMPGGTCLNVGCIPSKALLESSALFEKCSGGAAIHGIETTATLDLVTMMARKEQVVGELTGGIRALLEANSVALLTGRGRLLADKQVEFTASTTGEHTHLSARNVILATGSSSRALPELVIDGESVVDSSGALAFDSVPQNLAIIGAGVIGLELGTVWRRLGSRVTLFKSSKQLLSNLDPQLARLAKKLFTQQGLRFQFGTSIDSAEQSAEGIQLNYRDDAGVQSERFDKVVVAVGREPNSRGLFANDVALTLDSAGRIEVDQQCRTSTPGVYAIGDLVRGPMLAHKGSEEGLMVAELIAGNYAEVNYDTIPSVIYTAPEIAWCGRNESQLKEQGIAYQVGSFPFGANGRARAGGDSEGFVKVIADAATDRVLGVQMIGPHCSELIAQAVIAMEFKASSEDLALTVFAHPTLAETFHEAAMDVTKRASHKGYG